ncbi:MAG: DUF4118 domain-containing protein [Acidobacteria bacterium]|nr:DUF4118 domain-containing protein [Acidobacteriota bacterium]
MRGMRVALAETAQRYAAAVLSVAVTLLLVFLFWPVPELASTALLFVLPVAASSLSGGPGPGVLAAILAGLSIDYFLLKPNAYVDVEFGDAVRFAVFILTALMVGGLQRAAQEEACRRRQFVHRLEEIAALYELESRVAPAGLPHGKRRSEPPAP